jgi:substrate import-associated zinc metallohydrolase lipoprotein
MPPDFKTVTEADYLYASYTDSTTSQANRKGFVTQYARKNAMEDFAELYCTYIATDSTQWVNFVDKLTDVYSNTGKTGGQLITEKITIVRNYMLNMFGIDMDELRVIVLRKQKEIGQLKESDFITFK